MEYKCNEEVVIDLVILTSI